MTPDELLATLAKDYETWPIQLAVRPELCHEIAACLGRLAAAEADADRLAENSEDEYALALHERAVARRSQP